MKHSILILLYIFQISLPEGFNTDTYFNKKTTMPTWSNFNKKPMVKNTFYYTIQFQKTSQTYQSNKNISRNALRAFSLAEMKAYLHHTYGINSTFERKNILNQIYLYQYDSFIDVIKTFPEYCAFIQALAKRMYKVTSLKFYKVRWYGLKEKILKLKDEAIEAQKEKIQKRHDTYILQQKRSLHATKVNSIIQSQRMALRHCKKRYQEICDLDCLNNDQQIRYINRIKAIDQLSQSNKFYDLDYDLLPQTIEFVNKCRKKENLAQKFSHCYGNNLQHLVYKECVSALNTYMKSHSVIRMPSMHNLMLNSVQTGCNLSKSGHILEAFSCADVCWAIVDFTQAIGEGVFDGISNVVSISLHPIETIENVAYGLTNIAYYAGKMVYTLGLVGVNYCMDPRQGKKQWNTYCEGVSQMSVALCNQLKQLTFHDTVRGGTAFIVETILMTKLLSSTHKICRIAKKNITQLIKTTKASEAVAVTAEGIPINVARNNVQKFEAAKEAVRGPRKYIELVHANVMQKVRQEVIELKKLFDNTVKGFAECANKYIKIDYEHILGMDLTFSQKGIPQIKGFHHDFMGKVERSRLFEFVDKVVHESGFYEAKILHKGHIVKHFSTFFPKEWSRKKVISIIHEAYVNFLKSDQKYIPKGNGKYFIEGKTKEGIIIEMYITKKGLITSAYPVL